MPVQVAPLSVRVEFGVSASVIASPWSMVGPQVCRNAPVSSTRNNCNSDTIFLLSCMITCTSAGLWFCAMSAPSISCLISSTEALVGNFMASAKSRSCAPLSPDELRESVIPSGKSVCCNCSSFDSSTFDCCGVVHALVGEGESRWDLHCKLLACRKLCCSAISYHNKSLLILAHTHIYMKSKTIGRQSGV